MDTEPFSPESIRVGSSSLLHILDHGLSSNSRVASLACSPSRLLPRSTPISGYSLSSSLHCFHWKTPRHHPRVTSSIWAVSSNRSVARRSNHQLRFMFDRPKYALHQLQHSCKTNILEPVELQQKYGLQIWTVISPRTLLHEGPRTAPFPARYVGPCVLQTSVCATFCLEETINVVSPLASKHIKYLLRTELYNWVSACWTGRTWAWELI